MPRTFKATIALISVLIALSILTIINVFQTNSAEDAVIDMRQQIEALSESNARISEKLEQGVAVSGASGQTSADVAAGKYADALDDPDNILHKPTDLNVPPDAKFGGTLRRAMGDTPKGYNWLTENSVDVANLQRLVHSKLARRDFNEPDNFVPDLAYKITVNDDYTEYTVHIREGVYWHVPKVDFSDPQNEWMKKPREVTAEDCVFYFELVKNPQVEAGAAKNYYEDMEKAEVIDRYTFKVTWKRKVYNSLPATVEYAFPLPKWLFTKDRTGKPLPKETLGLKFNSHWASQLALGIGPYEHMETKSGEHVKLRRYDKYWGKKFPIEEIEYIIIKDPEASYLKLKADEIDFMGNIPAPRYKSDILSDKPSAFSRGELEYRVVDRFAYYYIGWNADKDLFGDQKVRLAMTHAMDRPGIIKNVFHGLGTIQTGPFYYKHPATDPNVTPYVYDLDKARTLLDEAGWKDSDGDGIRDKMIDGQKKDFRFNVLSYDSPTFRSVLAVYKESLRKIGVLMTPQPVDWPTMQKKMNEKKFDAVTGGWGLGWEIDPYQIWHSSQADVPKGSNRVGFRNDRADELIEKMRVTFDEDKRMKLAHEFHRLLHETQPYTFILSPQAVPSWQPRLENVVINSIRPQFHSLPWYIDPSVETAAEKK